MLSRCILRLSALLFLLSGAISCANKAVEHPVGERADKALYCMKLGDSLRALQPQEAFNYAQQAIALAKELSHDSLYCAALARMAQAKTSLGAFDESIQYYDTFLNECGRRHPQLFLNAQINRGTLYISLGNYLLAEESFRQAEEVVHEHGSMMALMVLRQSKSRLYYLIDEYSKMLSETHRLRRLALRLADSRMIATSYTTLGLAWLESGNQDSANYYQRLALNTSVKNDDLASAMHTHINLAELFSEQGIFDSVYYHLSEAQQLATDLGDDQALITALISESYNLYYEGNFKSAFDKLDVATSMRDSLVTLEQARYLEELEVRFETKEKANEINALVNEQKIDRLRQQILIVIIVLVLITGFAITWNLIQRRKHDRRETAHRIEQLEREKSLLALESTLYAQEEERQRIAKDLHDGIGALLSTARMQINKVQAELDKLQNVDLVKDTETIIAMASKEVRRVSHNMMPGILIELGLREAIEDFLEKQRLLMEVDFLHEGLNKRFPNEVEIMVYRIVQELVHNSAKHSKASQVDLSLVANQELMTLEYQDNGMGFNREEWDSLSNLGLNSIRSRAHFLKGKIELDTAPGKGVSYTIVIPLNDETP